MPEEQMLEFKFAHPRNLGLYKKVESASPAGVFTFFIDPATVMTIISIGKSIYGLFSHKSDDDDIPTWLGQISGELQTIIGQLGEVVDLLKELPILVHEEFVQQGQIGLKSSIMAISAQISD
jgi:hypothetical protein